MHRYSSVNTPLLVRAFHTTPPTPPQLIQLILPLHQLFGRPYWKTPRNRSREYVDKLCDQLETKGVELNTSTPSQAVRQEADGTWTVVCGENGEKEISGFDEVSGDGGGVGGGGGGTSDGA